MRCAKTVYNLNLAIFLNKRCQLKGKIFFMKLLRRFYPAIPPGRINSSILC
jgi:hypothetical protein